MSSNTNHFDQGPSLALTLSVSVETTMENHGERDNRAPTREQGGVARMRTQLDDDEGGYPTTTNRSQNVIEEDDLNLTLGLQPFSPSSQRQLRVWQEIPQTPPVRDPPLPSPPVNLESVPPRARRARRNTTQSSIPEGKSETVPIPFPWATDLRAEVHSLNYLLSNNINTITGEMQCKKCEKRYELGFDLVEKFQEVGGHIFENMNSMHERAPPCWTRPVLPDCKFCHEENSVHPVITKKKTINWLFLLLGEMLGCCSLEQLKYFCKHNQSHRTGAKNRLLYLTYIALCNQLVPDGPFSYP